MLVFQRVLNLPLFVFYQKNLFLKNHLLFLNNFYNLFRNTFKILLNKRNLCDKKPKLKHLLNKKDYMNGENYANNQINYYKLLHTIKDIIKEVMTPHILFVSFDSVKNISTLYNCLDLNKEKCKSNCSFSINNGTESCKFLFPKNDFTNKSINNETLYFNKLADEIIRYSYIYNFIFNRNYILAIEEVNYKISDKEIMIFDSNLENYFDKEILKIKNKFVSNEEVYDNNKAITNKEEKFLEYDKLNCIRK